MRHALSLFLLFVGISAMADSYKPMLTNGKEWKCRDVNVMMGNHDFTVTVCGDSIVDGLVCKKLLYKYEEGSGYADRYEAAYEENGKVYLCDEMGKREKFILLLDFTISEGDKVASGMEAVDEDVATVDGQQVRRLKFDSSAADGITTIWVEGVGASVNRFCTTMEWPTNGYVGSYMLECRDNGRLIYTAEDFQKGWLVNGITTTEAVSNRTSATWDLSGRRIKTHNIKEVYIKDGKKILNSGR